MAQTNLILTNLRDGNIRDLLKGREAPVIDMCKAFSELLSDPMSDYDVEKNQRQMERLLGHSLAVWEITSLRRLYYRFSEACRSIAHSAEAVRWLATFCENADQFGSLAEEMAITLERQRVVVDALSQIAALSDYVAVTGRGSRNNPDQVQQAADLAKGIEKRLGSHETGPS